MLILFTVMNCGVPLFDRTKLNQLACLIILDNWSAATCSWRHVTPKRLAIDTSIDQWRAHLFQSTGAC